MQTKVVTNVEQAKEQLFFGYERDMDWFFVDPDNEKDVEEAAFHLKISTEAVSAIAASFNAMNEYLVDLLVEDLRDIWEKISRSNNG